MRVLTWILIVTSLTIAACNKTQTPTAPTGSGAVIAISGINSLGNTTVGSSAAATMTISNTGTATLIVSSIGYPAGFSGNWPGGNIAPGASQVVTVTFTPTSATTYNGTITVNANHSGGVNTVAVSGTGVSVPTFTLSGVVTETAPTTSTVLAGARITFLDGANAGRTATSGADGRYEVTGVANGGYTISVILAGYQTVTLPVGIDGNTTLTIRLNPLAPRTSFGPGQYRVTIDMPAGRYYADPSHGCRFQRLRGFSGSSGDVLAEMQINFDARQWIVDLAATDAGFTTDGACGSWFTTPRHGTQTTITAGTWLVGTQVAAGTYRADNSAAGCEWQRLSGFSGSASAVIGSGFASTTGAQLVTIAATDIGFMTNATCGTWTSTGTSATRRR